nr:retrovirus-related Pol polyprotein from transposon TNT 1-94 [Tanacetum cinerariifolium]
KAEGPAPSQRLWQPPVLLKIVPLFVFDIERPHELLHSKLPDLSFFHVFGALCYPTNDSENLGLVPTSSPSTYYVPPLRNDWDLRFQPMFDELLNPSPSVVNQTPEANAPIAEVIPPGYGDSTGSPSSTTVEQDAPSTSNSPTPSVTQSSVIPQDEELNEFERLEVWELVPRPDQMMVITLKWIYKTPYELMHGKQLNLSFFHVFGALCYPTNDSENVGKLQPKADIGIFIGYAPTKKAFRIYNRRTRRIVETIHVDFDELMLGSHFTSGLVQKSSSSTSYVPPSRNDWDLLFQPLFDELLNPPPSVDNQAAEVISPIAEVIPQVDDDSTGSPSSTIVDQDARLLSKSPTPTET